MRGTGCSRGGRAGEAAHLESGEIAREHEHDEHEHQLASPACSLPRMVWTVRVRRVGRPGMRLRECWRVRVRGGVTCADWFLTLFCVLKYFGTS